MSPFIIGILSSEATRVIKAFNTKLKGTVIEGDGALIVSSLIALIIALIKVFYIDDTPFVFGSYAVMGSEFASIWTVSQLYFKIINLDLSSSVNNDVISPVVDQPADVSADL